MRAEDLDLHELLEFDSAGGIIRFGGARALLFDDLSLGLFRQELIERHGLEDARLLLTRLGWAQGWRAAERLAQFVPWDDEAEWRGGGGAGPRLHTAMGHVFVKDCRQNPPEQGDAPLMEGTWIDSWEAQQQLRLAGPTPEPCCWTLTGWAGGYLSFCYGEEVYAIESRCQASGDESCYVQARRRTRWAELGVVPGPDLQVGPLLERLRQHSRAQHEQRRAAPVNRSHPQGTIAKSAAMRRVIEVALRFSSVDTTVMLGGESGAGKEKVARLIHDESSRRDRPFVAVNCGAIPDALFESELFGHARGSFTGAQKDRVGLFEAANGGTLFLDEVGEISAPLQVKLLRVLQEKEVRRVGENVNRPVDVRIVCATNKDLAEEVAAGRFRDDLFYRLRVLRLHIPPLRERPDDVAPMARAFLKDACAALGRPSAALTPGAMDRMRRYGWPGNVRELRNAIDYAAAMSTTGRVEIDDLPEEVRAENKRPRESGALGAEGEVLSLVELERRAIFQALQACGGSRARAAARLGIGLATLYRKIQGYAQAG